LLEELERLRAFRRLVECMPFGVNIVRIDRQELAGSRFLFLNEEAWKQGGVDPDAWVGRTFGEAMPDALDLPEESNFPRAYARVVASGEPEVLEIRYGQANMPESVFNLHCTPLGDDLCALLYENITARRRAEERVKQHLDELARSNRELEQFAYVASHDLQEPLRTLLGFGGLLVKHAGEGLDDRSRGYLERMQDAAERMQRLINDLLELSRVSTHGRPFDSIELDDVVQVVLSDLETRIEGSGGRVVVQPLPRIHADALQMRQLFQNLVGNALKFHHPDRPPRVEVTVEPEAEGLGAGGGWRFRVRDNGIGFDADEAERIFEPFRRLHGRASYEGTGIGLAICMKITQRHGGSILASSQPGQGACFEVLLPSAPPSRDAA